MTVTNSKVEFYKDFWYHVEISLNFVGITRFNTQPVTTLKRRLLNAIFCLMMLWLSIGNANLIYFFFKVALTLNDYLQIAAIISYLSYTMIAITKIFRLLWHTNILKQLLQQLTVLFPTENDQRLYPSIGRLVQYFRRWVRRNILIQYCLFSYSGITLNSYISLLAAGLAYLRNGPPFERRRPYLESEIIPVDNLLEYISLYIFEAGLGVISSIMSVVSDVIFFFFIVQLIIQFESIAVKLREYKPSGKAVQSAEDRDFLAKIVHQHALVLDMVEKVNDVFQFLVFFNFMTAMSILCFMGFLAKFSDDNLTLIKNMLLLIYEMLQIWLMSALSARLKEASLSVVNGAYDQQWFHTNTSYQKSLRLIITRAQEPAVIKGYFFKSVDMEDFTNVVMTSYKFLAAFNTMVER